MLGKMGRRHAYAMALAIANVKFVVCDLAEMYTTIEVYSWQKASEMQLSILESNGLMVPLTYTVIPLTTSMGLNESQVSRGVSYTVSTFPHVFQLEGLLTYTTENQH